MRTSNQIRSDISVVGRGLTGDKSLKYVFGGVPAGAHAAYNFEQNAIFLPVIDQDMLTDEQISHLMAWDRHERLHWEKSCGEYMKKEYKKLNELEQELFQRLEDSRIESGNISMTASEMKHRRIHNDQAVLVETGSDEHLDSFRMSEYKKICEDYIKISTNNRWGYLAMSLQFKIAGNGDFPIPKELKKFWDIGWSILSDGRFSKAKKMKSQGTWIIGQLAKDIYRAWQKEEENQEKKDSQESNNSKKENGREKNGQESNSGQKDKSKSSQGNKKSKDKKNTNSISSEFKKSNQGKYGLDPKNLQSKIGQMALEQMKKGVKLDNVNIPYNMEDEDIIPKEFPNAFSTICSQITDKAYELRGMLSVILRSITHNSIEKNKRNGRINKRALPGVLSGKTKVMQKKTEGIDLDTDVQIIIDLSGSMWGNCYKGVQRSVLAACVAVCLSEALHSVYGIEIEVIGFNSLIPRHLDCTNGMQRSSDRVMTYFFKKFEESYPAVKDRMGSMAVPIEKGGSVGGCNVDHEVIWRGAHRLVRRGKKRKIQFVLSDGIPSGCGGTYGGFLETELIKVNKKIQKLGIEQVAIGIQSDSVEKFYPKFLILKELEKLDQEALNLIAEMFLSRH